jgi:hypothetical protein
LTDAFEEQFTPEEQLEADMTSLAMKWQELGIDPDDFLRCYVCHKFFPLLVEGQDVPEEELCKCGPETKMPPPPGG